MPRGPRQTFKPDPAQGFAIILLLGLLIVAALTTLTLMWQREMIANRGKTAPARPPAVQKTEAPAAESAVAADPAQADAAPSADGANAEDAIAALDAAGTAKAEAPVAGRISMKDCQWLYDRPMMACARQGDGACKSAENDFPPAVSGRVAVLSAKPGFSAEAFHSACLLACLNHAKPELSDYSRNVCGIP